MKPKQLARMEALKGKTNQLKVDKGKAEKALSMLKAGKSSKEKE